MNQTQQEIENAISASIPQTLKHECQHVDKGACLKCRFPFTYMLYTKKTETSVENNKQSKGRLFRIIATAKQERHGTSNNQS